MIKVTINKPPNLDDPDIVVVEYTGGLLGTFTNYGNQVFQWCADNEIDIDMITTWYDGERYLGAWRIANDQHRTAFLLRWS